MLEAASLHDALSEAVALLPEDDKGLAKVFSDLEQHLEGSAAAEVVSRLDEHLNALDRPKSAGAELLRQVTADLRPKTSAPKEEARQRTSALRQQVIASRRYLISSRARAASIGGGAPAPSGAKRQ